MKPVFCAGLFLLLVTAGFVDSVDAQRGRRGQRQGRSDSGSLQVGEMAPTFVLKSLDGESETDLASFRGNKPVVLFFGSYT